MLNTMTLTNILNAKLRQANNYNLLSISRHYVPKLLLVQIYRVFHLGLAGRDNIF